MIAYKSDLEFARQMDEIDPLRQFRSKFHIPKQKSGEHYIYFCGNSLGLQPKTTENFIQQELIDWKNYGVEGHFKAQNPWMPYHEFLTEKMARLVGAKKEEVVVMNTLSVNLHLMMVSFYRPKAHRCKILIEEHAFPSDKYAAASQIRFHGYDPEDALLELKARPGEETLRSEDIKSYIEENGHEIALIMLGNTNYYTGQFFDMKSITEWGHKAGCLVGFDCAHGAGNVPLQLREAGCDFAVWCNYKYLNSGPGALGGVFVHQRHHTQNSPKTLNTQNEIPRFEGWWGHKKETRFKMRDDFEPIPTVEAWQLSNPTIFSMAAIWASLNIFDEAGIENCRKKSISLTGYLFFLIENLGNEKVKIITPKNEEERGSQLSIQVVNANKDLYNKITEAGVIADWREPDVIRIAPTALYNTFTEVYQFCQILKNLI